FAAENPWSAECGRAADGGSFGAFVAAVSGAKVTVEGEVVTYESPSIGRFTTGWDVAPAVNGEAIRTRGYPLVESPWAQSAFGSGEIAVTHGDERYEIWANF
ncbi:MAG TPA: hypothetical protein VFN74_12255, partial [Chloroflexota bacterium]|nr:hypothetical protein [Chloroflexota bacterium]